jgi:hypothetical protein
MYSATILLLTTATAAPEDRNNNKIKGCGADSCVYVPLCMVLSPVQCLEYVIAATQVKRRWTYTQACDFIRFGVGEPRHNAYCGRLTAHLVKIEVISKVVSGAELGGTSS